MLIHQSIKEGVSNQLFTGTIFYSMQVWLLAKISKFLCMNMVIWSACSQVYAQMLTGSAKSVVARTDSPQNVGGVAGV